MNMMIIHIIRIWHGSRHQTVRGRRAQCSGKRGRCGLTLIEILIATALMAALLVALWRLVGIYTSLRGKGELHAGRVGNVSVMMQQLEEDLQNLPDIRPQPAVRVPLAIERETGTVDSEIIAFDKAYDDEPAVETLSESAAELEGSGRRSAAISQHADFALSEEGSFDSQEGPDVGDLDAGFGTNHFDTGSTTRQQAQACRNRSEECANSPLIANDPVAASCLIGDEQSLTLANLNCQVSRRRGEGATRLPPDLLAESGLSHGSPDYELSSESGYGSGTTQSGAPQYGAAPQVSGESVTLQMPVHFVRYWLASVMPLIAQTTEQDQNRVDTKGLEPSFSGNVSSAEAGTAGAIGKYGADGDLDSDERISGLYREEIVGVSMPTQLRSLRGRNSLENLTGRSSGGPSNFSGTGGLDLFEGQENSEEVIRHSFHLAQVEWAKFRYFDGNQWTSTWDSRVRGELPVAIEMSLWLLQLNSKQTSGQVTVQNLPASGVELTRAESEPISEPQAPFSIAEQEPQVESGEFSSTADDNPMERQPEIRQLVVLRSAPLSGEPLRGNGLASDGLLNDGLRSDGLRGDGLRGDDLRGEEQLRNSISERNPNLSPPSSAFMPR